MDEAFSEFLQRLAKFLDDHEPRCAINVDRSVPDPRYRDYVHEHFLRFAAERNGGELVISQIEFKGDFKGKRLFAHTMRTIEGREDLTSVSFLKIRNGELVTNGKILKHGYSLVDDGQSAQKRLRAGARDAGDAEPA